MSNSLQDKWILITGASSGFGAAAARHFAMNGANLLLGARREDRLQAVVAEAEKLGAPRALFHRLDVARTESVNGFTSWALKQTKSLDALINNAGGAHGLEPVEDGRDEDWETMLQINVLGILRMCRAFIPTLKQTPGSMILNIGSIAGRTAYEGGAVYCASKSAELAITKALRLELNGTGVRVGTLDPGMAETEFSDVRFKGDHERARGVYEGVIPLSADDVAEAMVWMINRPPHVCVDELVIKPTDQAAPHKVHRRS